MPRTEAKISELLNSGSIDNLQANLPEAVLKEFLQQTPLTLQQLYICSEMLGDLTETLQESLTPGIVVLYLNRVMDENLSDEEFITYLDKLSSLAARNVFSESKNDELSELDEAGRNQVVDSTIRMPSKVLRDIVFNKLVVMKKEYAVTDEDTDEVVLVSDDKHRSAINNLLGSGADNKTSECTPEVVSSAQQLFTLYLKHQIQKTIAEHDKKVIQEQTKNFIEKEQQALADQSWRQNLNQLNSNIYELHRQFVQTEIVPEVLDGVHGFIEEKINALIEVYNDKVLAIEFPTQELAAEIKELEGKSFLASKAFLKDITFPNMREFLEFTILLGMEMPSSAGDLPDVFKQLGLKIAPSAIKSSELNKPTAQDLKQVFDEVKNLNKRSIVDTLRVLLNEADITMSPENINKLTELYFKNLVSLKEPLVGQIVTLLKLERIKERGSNEASVVEQIKEIGAWVKQEMGNLMQTAFSPLAQQLAQETVQRRMMEGMGTVVYRVEQGGPEGVSFIPDRVEYSSFSALTQEQDEPQSESEQDTPPHSPRP